MPLPRNEFADKTCSAPAERSARMLEIVLQHVAKDRALDVLDLGCGTGSLVFVLAESMPSAMFVGLDVSAPNIRHAEAAWPRLMLGRQRASASNEPTT